MIQENIQTYLPLNMINCGLNVAVLIDKWVSGGIVVIMLTIFPPNSTFFTNP
jgi:hypothetical protein